MHFRVLGPLEVVDGDLVFTPTAPKEASVLSMLLLRANHLLQSEALAEEIWGESAPPSANATMQTYIYHLRCALGRHVIVTSLGGYLLPVDDASLDLLQFRSRVDSGRSFLCSGRPAEARAELRFALSLWKGTPLSNVRAGSRMDPYLRELDEERRRAVGLCLEAEFALGRHLDVIGELKVLVSSDPYNEWLHARLIEALYMSGRRRDALQAYESVRKLLAEHLGLQPSQELQELERRVLGWADHVTRVPSALPLHSTA